MLTENRITVSLEGTVKKNQKVFISEKIWSQTKEFQFQRDRNLSRSEWLGSSLPEENIGAMNG